MCFAGFVSAVSVMGFFAAPTNCIGPACWTTMTTSIRTAATITTSTATTKQH